MDAIVEPFLGGASCNFSLLQRASEVPKRNQPLLGYATHRAYPEAIETTPPRGALMAFAEKLVAVRRAHNLTQDQLAEKLYVTRQAVSR